MDLEYRKNWDDYVYGKLAMGKSKYWSEASLTENYNKIPQMLIPISKGPKEMSHWSKPPPLKLVLQVQIPTSVYKMWAMQPIEESLKKTTIKIENSNTENVNWTLTIVNKCLILHSP